MQRSEHVEAAERAGLRYTPDSMRGIRRERVAGAFVYFGSNGQPLTNEQKLRRIRSLAIPPTWTDVWICPDANGHLQVTARDARGRKQYRYHPKYRAIRDETKFDPGAKFHIANNVPYLRYFLSYVLQFQFYEAACQQAGWEGPLHRCTVFGNREVGERFNRMLEMGASRPWPDALEAFTGTRQMDGGAMARYFQPLMTYMQEQNRGRTCGW